MTTAQKCPCSSGLLYKACCAPFHRGAEPPDAEALMRSRYAAFALHDDDYLWRTLHSENAERKEGRELYRRSIRGSKARYMGLSILDRSPLDEGGIARVLFLAKVFERGSDLSFVELSDFMVEDGGFRYRSGAGLPLRAIKADPLRLMIASFRALLPR